ncbi:hypothetical protein HELRODRAFT_76160, partial [Helobdella robusta]|uniref:Cytochrome b-c1 complex subunit 7 n=1 Tax=Helobdella robusta TaxID=6412 RepID=T1G2F9_HELRO
SGWRGALRKWFFNASGYNQLGLLHDDLLAETHEVKEALRRLPRSISGERQFRISRALYLSMRKEILPKEEWTKYNEDVRYLRPYIEEVERELDEKAAWNTK